MGNPPILNDRDGTNRSILVMSNLIFFSVPGIITAGYFTRRSTSSNYSTSGESSKPLRRFSRTFCFHLLPISLLVQLFIISPAYGFTNTIAVSNRDSIIPQRDTNAARSSISRFKLLNPLLDYYWRPLLKIRLASFSGEWRIEDPGKLCFNGSFRFGLYNPMDSFNQASLRQPLFPFMKPIGLGYRPVMGLFSAFIGQMLISGTNLELAIFLAVLYSNTLFWLGCCDCLAHRYYHLGSSMRRFSLNRSGVAASKSIHGHWRKGVDIGVQLKERGKRIRPTAAAQSSDSVRLPFVASTDTLAAFDSTAANRTRYPHAADTVRCYSCMSPFYESAWRLGLSRIYAQPMNFSQQCDDSSYLRGISLVECPSICVKIREDAELSGIPFRGYIRGCYDTMLLHGFNQTLVRWFRWLQRDSCLDYNKYHILQLPLPPSSPRQHVTPNTLHICTCYADSCNGSPKYSGASVTKVALFGRSFAFSITAVIGPVLTLSWWRWSYRLL